MSGVGGSLIGIGTGMLRRRRRGGRGRINGFAPPPALCLRCGQQRRGELFVEGEEVFHALAVRFKWLAAIAQIHGAIQLFVRFVQSGRHGDGVQRRDWIRGG